MFKKESSLQDAKNAVGSAKSMTLFETNVTKSQEVTLTNNKKTKQAMNNVKKAKIMQCPMCKSKV